MIDNLIYYIGLIFCHAIVGILSWIFVGFWFAESKITKDL